MFQQKRKVQWCQNSSDGRLKDFHKVCLDEVTWNGKCIQRTSENQKSRARRLIQGYIVMDLECQGEQFSLFGKEPSMAWVISGCHNEIFGGKLRRVYRIYGFKEVEFGYNVES